MGCVHVAILRVSPSEVEASLGKFYLKEAISVLRKTKAERLILSLVLWEELFLIPSQQVTRLHSVYVIKP